MVSMRIETVIRKEVKEMLALGQLPESSSDDSIIVQFETALDSIVRPINDKEAKALLRCFGIDDCFGLAWSLIHIIESSPNHPLNTKPGENENEWLKVLWQRAT